MTSKIEKRDQLIADAVKAGESFSSIAQRFNLKISTVGKISRKLGVRPVVEFSLDVIERMYWEDREDNDLSPLRVTAPKPYVDKLTELEIGQSLFLANETSSMGFSTHANKRLRPRRFISQLEEDGVRIWRIL